MCFLDIFMFFCEMSVDIFAFKKKKHIYLASHGLVVACGI